MKGKVQIPQDVIFIIFYAKYIKKFGNNLQDKYIEKTGNNLQQKIYRENWE